MKINRERTKELYHFLNIDTILPAGDVQTFRKNLFLSYKNHSN